MHFVSVQSSKSCGNRTWGLNSQRVSRNLVSDLLDELVRIHEQVLHQILLASEGLNVLNADIANKAVSVVHNANCTDSLEDEHN